MNKIIRIICISLIAYAASAQTDSTAIKGYVLLATYNQNTETFSDINFYIDEDDLNTEYLGTLSGVITLRVGAQIYTDELFNPFEKGDSLAITEQKEVTLVSKVYPVYDRYYTQYWVQIQ